MERSVRIIGAPTDYGADRRGVDMGPSAIRYAGLTERIEATGVVCTDAGDLQVPRADDRPGTTDRIEGRATFLEAVEEVSRGLEAKTAETIEAGAVPLVLGGDHSIAIGTLSGVARDSDVGVVWFDAHGDFNTPKTTPSGNVHGMTLSAVLGHGAFGGMNWARAPGLSEDNVALIGLRDLDPGERERLKESSVAAFTMSDIDERGMIEVVEDALEVASAGVDGIHVSVDLDFLDPKEAPGVGTPIHGGASYREAHSALEALAERNDRDDIMRSIEFVEVNPILDERNETARLATGLAASAFGERIL